MRVFSAQELPCSCRVWRKPSRFRFPPCNDKKKRDVFEFHRISAEQKRHFSADRRLFGDFPPKRLVGFLVGLVAAAADGHAVVAQQVRGPAHPLTRQGAAVHPEDAFVQQLVQDGCRTGNTLLTLLELDWTAWRSKVRLYLFI